MKRQFCVAAFLLAACASMAAGHQGRVFIDRNQNGQWDKGEKGLAGVKVSDGLNVVETDAQGRFSLEGHEKERFVFVTTPSGYAAPSGHYHRIDASTKAYDFALVPYEAGIDRQGNHRFVHISDTEIHNTDGNEPWVKYVGDYAVNERAAFIIHTGDICYEKGLKEHIRLMNTRNMRVPVYYCIGNHDLVKGKYGEELFESLYGPVYYSFDVANVHYVVTPMRGGDHRPGYTGGQVCRWLKNDLAHVKKGTPVVVFNHDLLTNSDRFVYKGDGADSICLNDYNLKAWIYGHWHINHIKKQGDVYSISTATVDKGGIDHSSSSFRVMYMDGKGDFRSELRHAYIDKEVALVVPEGGGNKVLVNAYSTVSPVKEITVSAFLDGKKVMKEVRLAQRTDWTWEATLPLKEAWKDRELRLNAVARLNNGEKAEAEGTFVMKSSPVEARLTDNWDNLLGDGAHTAANRADVDSTLQLVWASNVGANLWMTSPLVHDGKILTASMDEDFQGKAHLYALDGKDGSMVWKFPLEHSVKNTVAITDGKVFAQDVLGNLYAVEVATGLLAWKAQLPVGGLPALIDGVVACDGVVYAGTGKALSAFDASTGKLLWRNTEWDQREGTTSTLAVGNGVLVGSVQWSALYGNDAKTGKKLWALSEHGLRHRGASAALHGSLLYIVSDQSFFIIESATGRIVVRKKLPYNVAATSTPLLTDREIIFGTADKGVVALDNQTLEEKWVCPVGSTLVYSVPYSRPDDRGIETSPVCVNGVVYVAASDGCVYGVSKNTGKIVWKFRSGAPFLGSVAVSGNSLVASDLGGNVYLFSTGK